MSDATDGTGRTKIEKNKEVLSMVSSLPHAVPQYIYQTVPYKLTALNYCIICFSLCEVCFKPIMH